jgi:hypothetical protein
MERNVNISSLMELQGTVINLLRTSVRYINTYATAEEAECPINRQSHNRYIE